MSQDRFKELPPELVLLVAPYLPAESRITPKLAEDLLLWASDSKLHIVKKMLAPPHSVRPSPETSWHWSPSALHVAAKAQNTEIALLLLEAGANPAAEDLEMVKLLLDHGAPVDSVFGCDGASETALDYACSTGHVEMVERLLQHGADLEAQGHYGTALGLAVHPRKVDAVRCLLGWGAEAAVTTPLMIYLDNEGPPLPHTADLLYVALGLRHPSSPSWHPSHPSDISNPPRAGTPAEWEGLPLGEE
ncbi:ankyrin repeat-containing domain protein [Mycena metata]|uniref:Ankyrin repeat-containing domain protein n=1 Tax=Mycena metata TaxID=1033252 RepID=A0AAD7IXZ2_9AGAR|nr:ankyrin repeat-containing domain protein [Mycena metata]